VVVGALLGGAKAPEAKTRLELAAKQEGDNPATEQEQEFECLNGHQRPSPGNKGGVFSIGSLVDGQYSRSAARCQAGFPSLTESGSGICP
jgi:hypothetical protein